MADLATRLGVGLLTVLALWIATIAMAQAQTGNQQALSATSRPAQFRFVGQVMKLTYSAYSGNRIFPSATIDPRGLGPNIPTCPTPPQEVYATFTCTATYTITPLDMARLKFTGAPVLKWGSSTKQGATLTVPLAPPDTGPPTLTLPADTTIHTNAGKATAVFDYTVSAHDPEDDVADVLLTDGPPSGSAFPLGPTTVSYSATDPSGNVANGSFTVTVVDKEAPELTVPSDMTGETPRNSDSLAVTFAPTPTATDNVDASPTVTCAPASGSLFKIGDTTVSCTATDHAGNTSAKTFTVTINDKIPPVLSVPSSDVTANTDPGMATAAVSYSATATDAGDPAPVVSCLPASGSPFPVGETTVSCTATDASHNVATSMFKVVVSDHEPPVVTPPADITIDTTPTSTPPGVSTGVVVYPNATAKDNVDPSVTPVVAPGSLPSGSTFPLGTTTVFFNATDTAGNTGTASFTVTVEDHEKPAFDVPENIVIAAAQGTASAVVAYTTPTATDNVTANPAVSCLPASGSSFAFGTNIVTCSSSDAASNQRTKIFTVTVTDGQAPTLTVPQNVVVGTDPGAITAVVNYEAATAVDAIDANPVVSCLPVSGSTFALGEKTVDCTAKDASGNIATGSFTVTVKDKEPPVLSLPGDMTARTVAGTNAASVFYVTSAHDNLDGSVDVTCNPGPGSFTFGVTTVACSATDAAGNTANGNFKVTVNDAEGPTLNLPDKIVRNTDAGKNSAKVTYDAVSATDAVDGAVTPVQTAGLASGADFPVGTTTLSFSATDKQGNTSTGSFTITVEDHEAPVVKVPLDFTAKTDAGEKTATVVYSVSATDAVNGTVAYTQTAGLASGASFPLGPTTVTFQATDGSGNVGSASFTVTVTDGEAPVLSVPGNISVFNDPGMPYATVTFNVSATDAVDGSVTPVATSELSSGAHFPVGVTTVTYVATDAQGNASAPKSFTVTVTDNEAPVLSVPANISVSTDAGKNTAKVAYSVSATDIVDGTVTPKLVAGLPSGGDFPVGTTTVTYKATDKQGNASAELSFTVTVTDGEPPVFTFVPGNISITIANDETSGTATWTAPSATDNAPGVTVTQTAGLPSGSSFPLGTTTNSFQAKDAAGNIATASFTVTVNAMPPGNVTFIINSPADGSFGFSSPEPALNIAVNSSGGHGSSGAITLKPGTYSFAFTVPGGFGIASARCSDPGSTIDAGAKSGTLTVASGAAIACTISTSDSADKAVALIGSFLESRADIIIGNQPDIDRRLERLTGDYSGSGGMSVFGMAFAGDNVPVGVRIAADRTTFAYSMQRARAGAAGGDAGAAPRLAAPGGGLQAGAGDLPISAYMPAGQATGTDAAFQHAFGPAGAGDQQAGAGDPMARRFDVWAEGTIGRFKSGSGDGSFGIAHTGADYLLTPNLLAGLSVQVDWLDQNGDDGATVSGVGYLIGPYATARLTDNLYLDARAGWGQSFNQVSPLGTFQDKFDGNRWLATAALIGKFDIDRWRIKPEARVTMFEEKTEAYVDGLGIDVPSVDTRTGQFSFGPTISTTLELEGGLQLTPFVALTGIWTFMQENSATSATATPGLAQTGLRGRAETGLELAAGNGMSINASTFYDGLGSKDYSSWGGKLGVQQRF